MFHSVKKNISDNQRKQLNPESYERNPISYYSIVTLTFEFFIVANM